MSLTLYLNRRDWFRHMEEMEELYSGCVPAGDQREPEDLAGFGQ